MRERYMRETQERWKKEILEKSDRDGERDTR